MLFLQTPVTRSDYVFLFFFSPIEVIAIWQKLVKEFDSAEKRL